MCRAGPGRGPGAQAGLSPGAGMSSAEQTVTWLISLGVLDSPKKSVSDPEAFLLSSLRDGLVLCRLLERLLPGSIDRIHQEPKTEAECLSNIKEFLKGCGVLRVETFDANDLYQGQNFNKILSSLVALNKVTADIGVGSDSVCARHQSHHIKSVDFFDRITFIAWKNFKKLSWKISEFGHD